MFSTKPYDEASFIAAAAGHAHQLQFLEDRLRPGTAVLAAGARAVCLFVNDTADAATLAELAGLGVRHVALRCAGFNHVDLPAAASLGLDVVRVPAYSP